MGFSDVVDRVFSIGKLPKAAPFRQQLALWRFRRLNLAGKYDFFIIAGDWALSGAVNNHPNLWYVHSPLNELWAFRRFIRQELLAVWKRPLYDIWVAANRLLTTIYTKSVDAWVCNSGNTKERIRRFYNREARIIYPPVAVSGYYNRPAGDYWLSVNRLITHKRVDLQVEAFHRLPGEKLVIVGSYEEGVAQFEACRSRIESLRPENVEIKSWVSDEELKELYANSRGFIATAKDEDFGLTVVEALAAGKPVIAPREGGYQESVVDGKTGRLLDDLSVEKLTSAIKEISEELRIDPQKYVAPCQKRAAAFDISEFAAAIKDEITRTVSRLTDDQSSVK
jgi:glycosyltransferase involved in cell wall biosynthesis